MAPQTFIEGSLRCRLEVTLCTTTILADTGEPIATLAARRRNHQDEIARLLKKARTKRAIRDEDDQR
jgi:hypothetical protein